MNELEGATDEGEMNTYPSDPGEFAYRWNSWTPEHREKFLRHLVEDSERFMRAWMRDGEAAKLDRLGEFLVLTESDGSKRSFVLEVKVGGAEVWGERTPASVNEGADDA